jgi:hypothetical protein
VRDLNYRHWGHVDDYRPKFPRVVSQGHRVPWISRITKAVRLSIGGEGGIRTPGTLAGTSVFETDPFDHSGTSPNGAANIDAPTNAELP